MTNTTNTTTRIPAIECEAHAMYRNNVGTNWAACDDAAITLRFSDGRELFLAATSLPNEVYMQALAHGLKQKLVDAAAISRNPDTGRSATIDDKYNAVREVYDRLLAGQWNKGRADGDSGNTGGLLFRALCIVYADKTPDAIREFLGKKTKEQQAALRVVPKIATIIDQLKAAKVKTTDVDTDALLDELND